MPTHALLPARVYTGTVVTGYKKIGKYVKRPGHAAEGVMGTTVHKRRDQIQKLHFTRIRNVKCLAYVTARGSPGV